MEVELIFRTGHRSHAAGVGTTVAAFGMTAMSTPLPHVPTTSVSDTLISGLIVSASSAEPGP
jgi:hypothetical protein